jgi:hypothetical protein
MQAESFPLNTVPTKTGRGTQARPHATPISSVSHLASQIIQSLRYMIPSITRHKIFCLEVSVVEGGKADSGGRCELVVMFVPSPPPSTQPTPSIRSDLSQRDTLCDRLNTTNQTAYASGDGIDLVWVADILE